MSSAGSVFGNGAAARGGSKRVRVWPPNRPPVAGEAVRTTCARCGLDWDVHEALAGFRLRCECDAWVPVPHPLGAPARVAPAPRLPVFAPTAAPERASLGAETRRAARADHAEKRRLKKAAKASKPKRKRARVIDRGLFGTLFLCALVTTPVVLAQANLTELSWAILWPAMGGLTAVLLGFAALMGRARYLVALRPARIPHLLEGLGVGLIGGAILSQVVASRSMDEPAMIWISGLITELGIPIAAVALVLLPALGHALFFREVLARRLSSLSTPRTAACLAAVALAFSHGLGHFTPGLVVLALHAAWLRKRSRSAVPGLIEDLAVAGVVFASLVMG